MTLKRLALATATCLAALPSAAALAQSPPGNDHYLQSLAFNETGRVGDPPPLDTELLDRPDTTAATEQTDLFAPPNSGGPPEILACDGVPFGKTVWYDVYPDRNGNLRVLATGAYDPVVAVYRWNSTSDVTPNPLFCGNANNGVTEELFASLERGSYYSVQVGGVNSTGGASEIRFGFFPTTVQRLTGDATLRATATPTGIRVAQLRVSAPRGARITVSCTRRGCRRQALTAQAAGTLGEPIGPVSPATSGARKRSATAADSPRARSARTRSFSNVRGRRLNAGAAIEIRITRRGAIGRYIKYTIRRGNFSKITRCMNPGSTRPRRRCSG